MQRCLGCMREYDNSLTTCPHCGYSPQTKSETANCLAPGTMLAGRYLVGRALGAGGFGITYIGWDSKYSTEVTVKEYLPESLARRADNSDKVVCFDGNEEKFENGIKETLTESNILARFNSLDGVVSVYNCVEENGTVYIILEHLKGNTLKEVLEGRGPLDFREGVEAITPILDALDKIHEAGVIHRDISPDNIFVCDDGKVKLIDFGAAKPALRREKGSEVVLKPGYAPPEQYDPASKQGSFTDVYATAATLYKMLTNTVPTDSLKRCKSEPLPLPSMLGVDIPPYAEHALMRAMSLDVSDRTATAGEFLRELTDPYTDIEIAEDEEDVFDEADLRDFGSGIYDHSRFHPEEEAVIVPPIRKSRALRHLFILIGVVFIVLGVIVACWFISNRSTAFDSGACGENLHWELTEYGVLRVTGTGKMDNFTAGEIPWKDYTDKIIRAELDDSVTSIGSNAFYACVNLSIVYPGTSLEEIGANAFFGCHALKELILPDSIRKLGSKAFGNCENLKTVHLPPACPSEGITSDTFSGCSALTICSSSYESGAYEFCNNRAVPMTFCLCSHNGSDILGQKEEISIVVNTDPGVEVTVSDTTEVSETLPPGTVSGTCGTAVWVCDINDLTLTVSGHGKLSSDWVCNQAVADGDGTEYKFTDIASTVKLITVSGGITEIGDSTFSKFTSAVEITLPDGITTVGNKAFAGCAALTYVNLPASVKNFGTGVFSGCTSLADITLPASFTGVPDSTFAGCSSLASFKIPDSATAIGNSAFSNCNALASVTIPAGVASIGSRTFENCTSLVSISIPENCSYIGTYAFAGTPLQSINLPSKLTQISEGTFGGCTALKAIEIPASVGYIGDYAFTNCVTLAYAHIPASCQSIAPTAFIGTAAVICNPDGIISNAPRSFAVSSGMTFNRCQGH